MDNVEFKDLEQAKYVKNVPVSNNQIKTRALSFKSIKSHWHNFVSNLALTKKVEKVKETVNRAVVDMDAKAKEFFDRFELKNCFFLSLDDRNMQMALVGAHPIKLKKTMQDGMNANLPFIKKFLGNKDEKNVESTLNNEASQITRDDLDSVINDAFDSVSVEEDKKIDVADDTLNRDAMADVIDNAFENHEIDWAPPAIEDEKNLEIPDFNLLADGEKTSYDGSNVANFANNENTTVEVPQEEVHEVEKEIPIVEVPAEVKVDVPEEVKEPGLEVASFANKANDEYNLNKEVETSQEEVHEEKEMPVVEEVKVDVPEEVKEPELDVASFANKANDEYKLNKEVETSQEEVHEEKEMPVVEEVKVEVPEEDKEPELEVASFANNEVASFANKANDEYNLNKEMEAAQEEKEMPVVEEVKVEAPEEDKERELEIAPFANKANDEYKLNKEMEAAQEEKEMPVVEEVKVEVPEEDKEPELEIAPFANNANREYRERMAQGEEVQDDEPLFTIVNEEDKPEEIHDYSFTNEINNSFSVDKLEELKKSLLETKKNNEEAKHKAMEAAEKKKERASQAEAVKKARAESEERLAVMFNKLNAYNQALMEDTEREERKANEDLDALKNLDADIKSDESLIKDYESQIDEINSLIGPSAENVQVRR